MGACKTALVTVVAAVTLGLAPNANADAVSRYFGARSKQARCIVGHESSGNPHAISPTGDYGLFQVNYRTWRGRVASFYEHGRGVWIRLPYTLDTFKRLTLKPLYNSRVAWAISHGGTDWSPWSSYSVHGFCREGA